MTNYFANYTPLLHEIDVLIKCKHMNQESPVIVAIDGMSGSGKTTFADYISQQYDCHIIHMDDFFLRKDQRTAERLSEIGGNIDYERFSSEVLSPLKKGVAFSYQKYDCKTGCFSKSVSVSPKPLYIIEGAYSTHPYFQNPYDLMLFLEIDSEVQKARILSRNGKEMYERFISEWIPMENVYFEAFQIRNKCYCFQMT